jgi:7,8-dihydropterin-6-yl-methyl-4-(beta-D-ribofuranosyl)aminobenzene 5'-phosphate synthase
VQEKGEPMIITLVYDNTCAKAGLQSDWGFSALIRYQDQRVLLDTGARGDILLGNMQKLGIDPRQIDTVVLSHIHQDHIGGLQSLLAAGAEPSVVLLPSFSQAYQSQLASQVPVLVAEPDLDLGPRIHTTGEIPGSPPEQALVLDTTRGLIVITGCAHPGVDRMVLEAKRLYKENIYLVIGGFHLGNASPERIRGIINEFQRLEVDYVAPCHCTGAAAKRMFREAFGDHFLEGGAGFQFVLENQ